MQNILFQLKITPTVQLVALFTAQYKKFRGEHKYNEVFSKIHDSKKVITYIMHLHTSSKWPNLKELGGVINSMSFFIFSKPETVLMGIIMSYCYWFKLTTEAGGEIPEEEFRDLIIEALLYGESGEPHISEGKGFFDTYFRIAYQSLPLVQTEEFPPYAPIYH